jgi:hypothetical protein
MLLIPLSMSPPSLPPTFPGRPINSLSAALENFLRDASAVYVNVDAADIRRQLFALIRADTRRLLSELSVSNILRTSPSNIFQVVHDSLSALQKQHAHVAELTQATQSKLQSLLLMTVLDSSLETLYELSVCLCVFLDYYPECSISEQLKIMFHEQVRHRIY